MTAVQPSHLPQLLQRPYRTRVSGHVHMYQPATAVLNDHEDVQQSKARRYCDEEIAGKDSLGMRVQDFLVEDRPISQLRTT